MKSAELFIERLRNDGSFSNAVGQVVHREREAGVSDYREAIITAAAEFGYEINKKELDDIYSRQMTELSEEELGKVSGGTSCLSILISFSVATSFSALTYSIHTLADD